ncbi:MAG TPA: M28 family peptidase [Gemmatimonadales bacterium]|jgi:Zn-dependent M28 family amino/carboxypeptidase|nr:M28 family peptidase [Gemmatimonadales bacterium]
MHRRPVAAVALLTGAIACAHATAVSGGALASIPPVHAGCPALPALDSVTMMSDLYRIADDSMRGRAIGSPGGIATRNFIAARFDALKLAVLPAGRVEAFTIDTTRARVRNVKGGWNVVGLVKGTRFPDQYIVVTAHYDHIGVAGGGAGCRAVAGDSICNGADDNGSGTVGLLALARYFEHAPPAHSMVFAAVDGEEAGLLGSRAFVANPPIPLGSILLNVNLDMVSRNTKNQLYAAGPGRNTSLEPLVQATADCAPIMLLIGHDSPGVPRDDWTNQSDQGAFAAKGIPFVYFGVEDHPDYHKPSDSPDRIMPGFFVGAVRTITDYIRRFDAAPVPRAP